MADELELRDGSSRTDAFPNSYNRLIGKARQGFAARSADSVEIIILFSAKAGLMWNKAWSGSCRKACSFAQRPGSMRLRVLSLNQ